MRARSGVVFDTEAEFNMATEFGMDFDYLCNHPDPKVASTSKRIRLRWWNTLNQHRECNLYREEMTFHEIDRINIATFCMALMRAVYKTAPNKTKYKFMGHSMSQMLRPLGYLVMGLIAKDHQGAHPGHIYTAILNDIRCLTDKQERRAFYTFFISHNKKFFEQSGLMKASNSYRKTTKRALEAGKEFGTCQKLVLLPQARKLIEEFTDRFREECNALTKEAVLSKNEYIHRMAKLGKREVVDPLNLDDYV